MHSAPLSLSLSLSRAHADKPGYQSPDRALVGEEEQGALAYALKRRQEADPKVTKSGLGV